MATLLIELEGPMQSWGYRSRFGIRDTGNEPTRSGVIGLLAASLGRGREADIADLAALRFGVRADREGTILREFQTAQNIIMANGRLNTKNKSTKITNRFYLSGARFIAGLQGDEEHLAVLREALQKPVYMQYLGMRGFTASVPFINPAAESITGDDLETALRCYPYYSAANAPATLRVVRDARDGEESPTQDFRQDVPVSFSRREFLVRKVITEWIEPVNRKER